MTVQTHVDPPEPFAQIWPGQLIQEGDLVKLFDRGDWQPAGEDIIGQGVSERNLAVARLKLPEGWYQLLPAATVQHGDKGRSNIETSGLLPRFLRTSINPAFSKATSDLYAVTRFMPNARSVFGVRSMCCRRSSSCPLKRIISAHTSGPLPSSSAARRSHAKYESLPIFIKDGRVIDAAM